MHFSLLLTGTDSFGGWTRKPPKYAHGKNTGIGKTHVSPIVRQADSAPQKLQCRYQGSKQ